MQNRSSLIFNFLCIAFIGLAIGGWYLSQTTNGAKILVRWALKKYIPAQERSFEDVDGNLHKGITVSNLVFNNLEALPNENSVTIARFALYCSTFEWKECRMAFDGARVNLPNSQEIIVSGFYDNKRIGGEFESAFLDLEDIKKAIRSSWTHNMSAQLKNVKGHVEGNLRRFQTVANFFIEEGHYPYVGVKDAPSSMIITFDKRAGGYDPAGQLTLIKGILATRDLTWDLQESKILFMRNPGNFSFNVRANINLNNTLVHFILHGTREVPEITLTSNPPFSELQLLTKLSRIQNGRHPASMPKKFSNRLSKAFVDYLFFGELHEVLASQINGEFKPVNP